MHVFLPIRVELSMVVTQKSDMLEKNAKQIRIQRRKNTQEQIKKFQIPKILFFVEQSNPLLKYCRKQCTYFRLLELNHHQNLIPKCKILKVFQTSIVSKNRIQHFNFSIGFLNIKNLFFSNYSKNAQIVIQWQ